MDVFPHEIFRFVIPAKAGTHCAASTGGGVGSRLRGNDGLRTILDIASASPNGF
jgi:hypothetical protein